MRTVKGYEALDIAEQHDMPLYDAETRQEVSADEARARIAGNRDAVAFILQNWPDSDEEANLIVFKAYQRLPKELGTAEASVSRLVTVLQNGLPLHPVAAELAAERLVQQGKLTCKAMGEEGAIYRLPRTVGFNERFLDRLHGIVCDECAELVLSGSFHETCLLNLVEFLKGYNFSYQDLREMQEPAAHEQRFGRIPVPQVGMRWLSKTATATRERWKSVMKPILSTVTDTEVPGDAADEADEDVQHTIVHKADGVRVQASSAGQSSHQKPKVSKDQLIRYLQSVEILEENGETARLEAACEALRSQLATKDEALRTAEQKRRYLEKQFSELQRDTDILVQAMQIAKRRDAKSEHIIDASYE